jgi:2-hydroxycyclohexanecarboxyl-CoA dehydrogenase
MMSLHGKVAVITGGAGGIRAGHIPSPRPRRCSVAVWDVDVAGAQQTARLIEESGGCAIVIETDVASAQSVALATDRTRNDLGPIAILVNNAALTGTPTGASCWEVLARSRSYGVDIATRTDRTAQ